MDQDEEVDAIDSTPHRRAELLRRIRVIVRRQPTGGGGDELPLWVADTPPPGSGTPILDRPIRIGAIPIGRKSHPRQPGGDPHLETVNRFINTEHTRVADHVRMHLRTSTLPGYRDSDSVILETTVWQYCDVTPTITHSVSHSKVFPSPNAAPVRHGLDRYVKAYLNACHRTWDNRWSSMPPPPPGFGDTCFRLSGVKAPYHIMVGLLVTRVETATTTCFLPPTPNGDRDDRDDDRLTTICVLGTHRRA
jgi:hypothetical protein